MGEITLKPAGLCGGLKEHSPKRSGDVRYDSVGVDVASLEEVSL